MTLTKTPNLKLLIYFLVATTTIAGIYFFTTNKIKSHTTSPIKVTVAQFGEVFLYAPLYIAKDAGFFSNYGLDVNFVSTGGDEKTWAAVLSGSADFGVADPTFVAVSGERGRAGKVIASIVNGVPFWGITYNDSIGTITDPKQLEGKRIATFPSPSTAYALQKKMFKEAGVSPNIQEGAFGTLVAMLKAKQADIALELEPNVSRATMEGAHVVYGLDRVYGDFAITGLTSTPDYLAKQPGIANRVTCALRDSIKFIAESRTDAESLMTKRFPEVSAQITKSAIARMIESGVIPKEIYIEKSAWDKAVALRIEAGDLKVFADYETYVDKTFGKECSSLRTKK